tara:strand:+ start:544 stop:2034 length:1491 start_codon:yes stop_codon:yes gene_type:complete
MSIPRVLRTDLREDGNGQSQRVESRVIQPLSGFNGTSQGRCEFNLPRQGILDRSSYIKFKVLAPNGTARLPLSAGAYSLIETATLRIGGVEIQTRRGFGQLATLRQFYRTPHDRDNRQAKRVGCFTGLMVDATQTAALGGVGMNKPGHWGVDTSSDWAYSVGADDREIATGYHITNDLATTPEWIIDLAVLFPILYSNSLPLGLLDNEINIILDLGEDLVRGQRSITPAATAWVTGTNMVEASLHVDLIFFDEPIGERTTMEQLRDQLDKGEKLVFTDDQYVLFNQPAGPPLSTTTITNKVSLGCDNQIVRNITIATPYATDYSAPLTQGNVLTGGYHSAGSQLVNTLQLTLNNNPVYPSPVTRDSELWNELSMVMPTKFKVNSGYYSWFGQAAAATGAPIPTALRITNKTLMGVGHEQNKETGQFHYYGINLSKPGYKNVIGSGTAIGRNPLLLELSDRRTTAAIGDNLAKTLHIWITCERLLSIMGGKLMVSGA